MIILNSKETKTYIYHSEIGNKKDYISLSFSFNLSDLNIIIIINIIIQVVVILTGLNSALCFKSRPGNTEIMQR